MRDLCHDKIKDKEEQKLNWRRKIERKKKDFNIQDTIHVQQMLNAEDLLEDQWPKTLSYISSCF
jgi:hypothetical protein